MTGALVAIGLALLTTVLLAIGFVSGRRDRARSRQQMQEAEQLRARIANLDGEAASLKRRLRDAIGYAKQLNRTKSLRDIPETLLDFTLQLCAPEEALVLIRRRPAVSDSNREHQLIAAATLGTKVRQGTVFDIGTGPLSQVAISGHVFDSELAGKTVQELPGFAPAFAVPLTADREPLGVVAVMGPTKNRTLAGPLLQLIAHSAGATYKSSSTLNRVRSEADLDALTGVLNKGALTRLFGIFVEEGIRDGRPLSLLLFDIDHFKNYNDANGHLAGDDCLRMLSRLVAEQVRADDAFGRWGGEEFLLLLPGRDLSEAFFVAEKIRTRIAEFPFPNEQDQPLGTLSISGGVAGFPDHGRQPRDLFEVADRALYAAKKAGRNRIHEAKTSVAEPEPPEAPEFALEEDDLQLISGIGPKFAAGLEELGVLTYRQLAELNWQGIVRVAEALGTAPERVIREQWLGQARELHRRSHTDEPAETDSSAEEDEALAATFR